MTKIRLALVDTQVMLRSGLAAQLGMVEGLQVVWQGETGLDLLDYCAANPTDRPQVVLWAISQQGRTEAGVTRRLKKLYPAMRVIILFAFVDVKMICRMVEAGAYGAVRTSQSIPTLAAMIHDSWYGNRTIDPAAEAIVLHDRQRRQQWSDDSEPAREEKSDTVSLTPREQEVLDGLCQAWDNDTIGKHLGISGRTVQTHLTHIYGKLQVSGRIEAVIVAIRDRWVFLDFLYRDPLIP